MPVIRDITLNLETSNLMRRQGIKEPGRIRPEMKSLIDEMLAVVDSDNDQVALLLNRPTPAFSEDCNRDRIPDECSTPYPGDADGDDDADLSDYLAFQACLTSPGHAAATSRCACFDQDGDGDVDLADIVVFQSAFTGAR